MHAQLRIFWNQQVQKIVLQSPKPIPSSCNPFNVVFQPYISENVQLLFTSTGTIFICACTEKTPPHREAFCPETWFWHQKYMTDMKTLVNLPLVTDLGKAGSRPSHLLIIMMIKIMIMIVYFPKNYRLTHILHTSISYVNIVCKCNRRDGCQRNRKLIIAARLTGVCMSLLNIERWFSCLFGANPMTWKI